MTRTQHEPENRVTVSVTARGPEHNMNRKTVFAVQSQSVQKNGKPQIKTKGKAVSQQEARPEMDQNQ